MFFVRFYYPHQKIKGLFNDVKMNLWFICIFYIIQYHYAIHLTPQYQNCSHAKVIYLFHPFCSKMHTTVSPLKKLSRSFFTTLRRSSRILFYNQMESFFKTFPLNYPHTNTRHLEVTIKVRVLNHVFFTDRPGTTVLRPLYSGNVG